jgi:DNA-binding MarR family transcriptional regulator
MPEPIENLDLSGFVDTPMAEVVPFVEEVLRKDPSRLAVDRLSSLFFDRTLQLLREGSRTQIMEECAELDRFLVSPTAESLKAKHPDLFGAWTALSDLLGEAGRRSDRAAVDSILASLKGYGRTILEMLAERGAPVPRSEILKRLDVSESHLSHILRDMDEADLIIRYRDQGKQIVIDLGPVGREVVERSVLPAWIGIVIEHLRQCAEGVAPPADADAFEAELVSAGAPSRVAAHRLAEALTHTASAMSDRAAANAKALIDEVSAADGYFADIQTSVSRPLAAFTVH